jgi:DNA-binding transcriptional ArsR family regulator
MNPPKANIKRKNKARRYRRRGVERAAVELAVLAMARDMDEILKLHCLDASTRRAALKNQRRQRSDEELEVLSLARILESLAKQYPRFAEHLRKLQYSLRKRLTRPAARRAEIMAYIQNEGPVEFSELVQCTLYDPPVVRSDIKVLMKEERIVEVNREGQPPRRTAQGRAVDRIFYQKAAGPSGVVGRQG